MKNKAHSNSIFRLRDCPEGGIIAKWVRNRKMFVVLSFEGCPDLILDTFSFKKLDSD